jgi:hypothetical protein
MFNFLPKIRKGKMSLEDFIKKNSKFGRDYISNLNRGAIPPDNLDEILKRNEGEGMQGISFNVNRKRRTNSSLHLQLQNQGNGSNLDTLKIEGLLAQPMISSYRSLLKELEAKRSRGIASMLG